MFEEQPPYTPKRPTIFLDGVESISINLDAHCQILSASPGIQRILAAHLSTAHAEAVLAILDANITLIQPNNEEPCSVTTLFRPASLPHPATLTSVKALMAKHP